MKLFALLAVHAVLIVGVVAMGGAYGSESDGISVNASAYNHSTEGIASYDVELSTGAAVGGGFVAAGKGGGARICCITLPPVWSPALKATVRKIVVVKGENKAVINTVAIPKYDASLPNHLHVHFLHDGSVKVFVTMYLLGHQQYPLRGKEAELVPGVPLKIRWK